jgi:glycolate oxidase FAD binding subunit
METALHNILERVRAAAADATPLRLCGGGSKDFHGLALEGTPLDLRPLRGIISY